MNRYIVVLLFVTLLPLIAVGQVSNEDLKTMLIVRDLERESRPSRSPITGPEVMGDPYYSPSWNPGTITIYKDEKTYSLSSIKYDMLDFDINVLIDGKLNSLKGNLVKSFNYTDSLTEVTHRFVNGSDFTFEGAPLRGFLEIMCWGRLDVYSFTEASLLKPSFNRALSAGNENFQIVKKKVLLYGPGVDLRPLKKKELTKLWKAKEVQMNEFQRINKLKLSKDADLLLMVDYFNTL